MKEEESKKYFDIWYELHFFDEGMPTKEMAFIIWEKSRTTNETLAKG